MSQFYYQGSLVTSLRRGGKNSRIQLANGEERTVPNEELTQELPINEANLPIPSEPSMENTPPEELSHPISDTALDPSLSIPSEQKMEFLPSETLPSENPRILNPEIPTSETATLQLENLRTEIDIVILEGAGGLVSEQKDSPPPTPQDPVPQEIHIQPPGIKRKLAHLVHMRKMPEYERPRTSRIR